MTTEHHPPRQISQNSTQIPPEILSHIFWYATAPSSSSPPEPDPDHPYELLPNPPLSDHTTFFHLSATCSNWRRVIHSSHTIQLSLSVSSTGREIHPDFPYSRICSLKLNHVRSEYAYQLLSLCPNLVEFIFDQPNDLERDDSPSVLSTLGNVIIIMEHIQTLSWVGSIIPPHPDFFTHFRFPAIHTLKWNVPLPSSNTQTFFESMSQVSTLHLIPSFTKHSIDQHLNIFSNLTKLVVKIIDDDEGNELLRRLTIKPNHKNNLFPRLQTMCLTISGQDIDPDSLIVLLYSRRNSPVDWSHTHQHRFVLPPYDSNSSHWKEYTRLSMFSVVPEDDEVELNWEYGELYESVMRPMFEEAKRVDEFGIMWSESLIVF